MDTRRNNLWMDVASNMGILEIDELVVTTTPEPSVYAALAGQRCERHSA